MTSFRFTLAEMLMLVGLSSILASIIVHVHGQIETHDTVLDMAFSPNNKLLAVSSSLDVSVFDLETRKVMTRLGGGARMVAFSADSTLLATVGADGCIVIWNVISGNSRCTMHSQQNWVSAVVFSYDSKFLYSAGREGAVKTWHLPGGTLADRIQTHVGEIDSIALSPDGNTLAVGGTSANANGHDVELWNVESRKAIGKITGPENAYVDSLSFAPNGRYLAVGLSVPTLRIWDVSTKTSVATLPDASGRTFVEYSPNGS